MKPRSSAAARTGERGVDMAASSNIGVPARPQHSPRMWRAIGLMSGTSLDGIDVAMIETDGYERAISGTALTFPYPPDFRERLRSVLGGVGPVAAIEAELTALHRDAVEHFLREHPGVAIDIVGFHGHTIRHRPAERSTWQIGDGALLASRLRLDVVADFRSADVAAGRGGAARSAVPCSPCHGPAEADRRPQRRRRCECDVDRRAGGNHRL